MRFDEFKRSDWALLSQVARPSRYSASEWRDYLTPVWDDYKNLRVCLAFPDVYEIGMSYYGFQILSWLIKKLGYLVDRAYCPWVDLENLLRAKNLKLKSLEQHRDLSEFDVIGFTLQHELSYVNILSMLDLAGVRLKACERDDKSPVIIAGGCGAFVPEPLADFIDAFCVGDGEVILPDLLKVLAESKGESREARLKACAKIPGVYVPSLGVYQVERQILNDFDDENFMPDSMIVPSVNIVHDRASLELFRGCSRGCRFCQAGFITRPVRERSPEKVRQVILKTLEKTGWDELGLLSLASCDYSSIEKLIDDLTPELLDKRLKLSLPSLRMDNFSVGLAGRLQKFKRGGLTFAPEAGTQRLRDVINKNVDENNINLCLREAFTHGWDRVKLYFMMGLPTETDEDLDGIVKLASEALKLGRSLGRRRASVSVSVAGFVPKAHTPFQWERQNSISELADKGRRLKSAVHDKNLILSYHEPEQTFLEGVLSRGDRRTGGVILRAWHDGARFDSWSDCFNLKRWLDAFEACGLDPLEFTRERGEGERLPWEFIKTGVTREFLLSERRRAYGGELSVDCRSGCNNCGLACKKAIKS